MPYPTEVAQFITEKQTCDCCGVHDPEATYFAHSRTGLHLVAVSEGGRLISNMDHYDPEDPVVGMRVTSTSQAFEQLQGHVLPLSANLGRIEELHDAHCLCYECHEALHDSARAEQQRSTPESGHQVSPALLSDVSTFYTSEWNRSPNLPLVQVEIEL